MYFKVLTPVYNLCEGRFTESVHSRFQVFLKGDPRRFLIYFGKGKMVGVRRLRPMTRVQVGKPVLRPET